MKSCIVLWPATLGALVACAPGPDPALPAPEITVASNGAPTAQASWPAGAGTPASTRVRVEADGEPWLVTGDPEIHDGVATVDILGLLPDAEWTAVVVDAEGDESEATSFVTPPLPTEVTTFETAGTPGWLGYVLYTSMSGSSCANVVDEQANHVWFWCDEGERAMTRVVQRSDGRGVWVGLEVMSGEPSVGELVSIGWSGEVLERVWLPRYTHDFVELADHRFVWLEQDCRPVDGARACGDALNVGDPRDGGRRLWSSFDRFEPGVHGEVDSTGDWTHANALDVDRLTSTAWVSLRNLDAIVGIDLVSGTVVAQLGGPGSDWRWEEPADAFQGQHQFQWLEDHSLLVHDNRDRAQGSRVVRVELDEEGTARVTETLLHEPPLFDFVLGDVHRDHQGNTLVTWSAAGMLESFSPEGESTFTAQVQLGAILGYSARVHAVGDGRRFPGVAD